MYSIMQFGFVSLVLSSLGSTALLNTTVDNPETTYAIQAGMHCLLSLALIPIILSYVQEGSSAAVPVCMACSFVPSTIAVSLALEIAPAKVLVQFLFLVSLTFFFHSFCTLAKKLNVLHHAVSLASLVLVTYPFLKIADVIRVHGIMDLLLCPAGSGRKAVEPSHLLYAALIYAVMSAGLQVLVWTKNKPN